MLRLSHSCLPFPNTSSLSERFALRPRGDGTSRPASASRSTHDSHDEPTARRLPGSKAIFFDDTKVQDRRELNVHDLDEVSKEHPVVVQHRGGHTSYYNGKALEMAGITKE